MQKQITKFEFEGTAKDFADRGLKLNGQLVDQMTVNAFGRHGIIECIGEGQKPARGKTPKKYRAVNTENMTWTMQESVPVASVVVKDIEVQA